MIDIHYMDDGISSAVERFFFFCIWLPVKEEGRVALSPSNPGGLVAKHVESPAACRLLRRRLGRGGAAQAAARTTQRANCRCRESATASACPGGIRAVPQGGYPWGDWFMLSAFVKNVA